MITKIAKHYSIKYGKSNNNNISNGNNKKVTTRIDGRFTEIDFCRIEQRMKLQITFIYNI